jgi:hypothetical protein
MGARNVLITCMSGDDGYRDVGDGVQDGANSLGLAVPAGQGEYPGLSVSGQACSGGWRGLAGPRSWNCTSMMSARSIWSQARFSSIGPRLCLS